MDTVIAACDLGLSMHPLCGILKFFKGLAYYKKGMYKKSTHYFVNVIRGNEIICDDKLKILFNKYQIPFDDMFMESLCEVYTKIKKVKFIRIIFLLSIITVAVLVGLKFWR